MTATAPPKLLASSSQALDGYLRILAGPQPGARLLEIRFALRHRDMGRLFVAAHSAPGASRLIRRLATRTNVYVGVCLRDRRSGGRDAIDCSHLAFVEIDTPDALDRLRAFRHGPTMIVLSGIIRSRCRRGCCASGVSCWRHVADGVRQVDTAGAGTTYDMYDLSAACWRSLCADASVTGGGGLDE